MNIYNTYFMYNNITSIPFGYRFAKVDEDILTDAVGEKEYTLTGDRRHTKCRIANSKYSDECLTFTAEIISDRKLTHDDIRATYKWLFNSPEFHKLYMLEDDTLEYNSEIVDGTNTLIAKREYLNCIFYNPKKIYGMGGVCGFSFTVTCDSPWGWQDDITKTFTSEDFVDGQVTLIIDSDSDEYILPNIVVTTTSTPEIDDITITNISDDNYSMILTDVAASQTVMFNSQNNQFSCSGTSVVTYMNNFNRHFLRLVNGENVISLSDNIASISITYSNARWLT